MQCSSRHAAQRSAPRYPAAYGNKTSGDGPSQDPKACPGCGLRGEDALGVDAPCLCITSPLLGPRVIPLVPAVLLPSAVVVTAAAVVVRRVVPTSPRIAAPCPLVGFLVGPHVFAAPRPSSTACL